MTTSSSIVTPPDPVDVDLVRDVLDTMGSFADNDQRARYLLSSNWLRDRGPGAAARLAPPSARPPLSLADLNLGPELEDFITQSRAVEGSAAGDLPACPGWCSLRRGHSWDGHVDGVQTRGHQGPRFGSNVSAGSVESIESPGVHAFDVFICESVVEDVCDPAAARELATNLVRAAEWAEAHR